MEAWTQTAIDTDLGSINVIRGGNAGPWVVCWPTLMGDHRSMSNDSRDFGPVEREHILGKAVLIYWPVDKLGLLR